MKFHFKAEDKWKVVGDKW